jgi:hypothetical protein
MEALFFDLGALLRNKFGYGSATQSSYNYQVVESEIRNQNRPVILSGRTSLTGLGHAWVCDGVHTFSDCIYVDGTIHGNTYLYFHQNWGGSNGWYGFANFTVEGNNYNSYMQMIHHIYP